MSVLEHQRAPGDRVPAREREAGWSGFLTYTAGLVIAVVLTAISFWAANT
jgi:cytochrome o ubiquinol oxidase subunit IV